VELGVAEGPSALDDGRSVAVRLGSGTQDRRDRVHPKPFVG